MKASILPVNGGIAITPENEEEIKILRKIWNKGEIKLFAKSFLGNKLQLGNNQIGLGIPGISRKSKKNK